MNNFPAMTEAQRQELIRHNRAKVNAITPQFLKESTPGVKKHLQREIDSAKIAIAALTAKPKAYLIHEKAHASWLSFQNAKGFNPKHLEEHEIWQEPLYTAPPAPVLRFPDEKHYKESPHGESSLWAMGWNECLAEVKRLNGQPSPPEASNDQ